MDALRHIEEVELLEEEFRHYIRACRSLRSIWTTLGSRSSGDNPLPSDINTIPSVPAIIIPTVTAGSCAYANKRAYWYSKLADDAERQFKSLGGSWPEEGQSFVSYLRARRPSLEVDWDSSEKEKREEENSMKTQIKTGELDKFIESLDDEGEEDSSDEDVE